MAVRSDDILVVGRKECPWASAFGTFHGPPFLNHHKNVVAPYRTMASAIFSGKFLGNA
jgi:hypothetical protein